jgi:hypothetical protein
VKSFGEDWVSQIWHLLEQLAKNLRKEIDWGVFVLSQLSQNVEHVVKSGC